MKKISIIMPIYNTEKFLERGINCVLNQTYKNIELILVNDGSTDNSLAICEEFANKDNRIKVVHKENGGVSDARNTGLNIATGEYIGFVDADDIIDADMYKKLVESLEENDSHLSMCGIKYIYEDGTEKPFIELNLKKVNSKNIIQFFLLSGSEIKNDGIYTENIMGSSCRILFRKEVIGEKRFIKLPIHEDMLFLIDIFKQDLKISVVTERLYGYFQSSTSAMRSFSENKFKERIKAFELILDKTQGAISTQSQKAFKFYVYAFCVNEALKNKRKDLLKYIFNLEFFKNLNTKSNYLAEQQQTKSFKRKFAYWLVHKKMFKTYSFLLKLI